MLNKLSRFWNRLLLVAGVTLINFANFETVFAQSILNDAQATMKTMNKNNQGKKFRLWIALEMLASRAKEVLYSEDD